MIARFVGAVDTRAGAVIEAASSKHHRRRLARVRSAEAFDGRGDGWSNRPPLPRGGKRMHGSIDGAAGLPAIADAVRAAESLVHLFRSRHTGPLVTV